MPPIPPDSSYDEMERLFSQLIELRSMEERRQVLEVACKGKPELREKIAKLIAFHDRDQTFLDAEDTSNPLTLLAELRPSSQFGEFVVVREIGRGGMGVVFEAFQSSLNRKVALKVLSVGLGFSDSAIGRFRREAEAAGRLHHTNIVPIYTTGIQGHLPYYAMELIDGCSLDQLIATEMSDVFGQGSEAYRRIALAFVDIADGLAHAHSQGVIHRDIKPSNLLVSKDGRIFINDFGLAQLMEEAGLTMTGEQIGSPRYMSPEQVSPGVGTSDHRSDVYSLGISLYELLARRPAFDGDNRQQVLAQVLEKNPLQLRLVDRRIPVDLETICHKAIEKEAHHRYDSASSFAEDLRRFANHRPILARRIGPIESSLRWCARNRSIATLSASLISLILILIGTHAWQIWQQHQRFQIALQSIERLRPRNEFEAIRQLYQLRSEFGSSEEVAQASSRIGRKITISSDRAPVEIFVRPIQESSSEWLALGTTPLTTHLPDGHFHIKTTTKSQEFHYLLASASSTSSDWRILIPETRGMVRVSEYQDSRVKIPWLRMQSFPCLGEFEIDRFEVTNREFKRFVDDGGYHTDDYWIETLGADYRAKISEFMDEKHEHAGPRYWIDGTYLPGEEDLPVVGISWFEAMAYAKWAGKKLPTVFHWLRASDFNGDYDPIECTSVSNIGNRDVVPRVHRGQEATLSVGTFGAFDMAGNVREWCLNRHSEEKALVIGGSWQDEATTMHEPVPLSPYDRRSDLGFRCARYTSEPKLFQNVDPVWRSVESAPRHTTTTDERQKLFGYDHAPWNTAFVGPRQLGSVTFRCFQIDTVNQFRDRMTIYIALPNSSQFAPPFETVIVGRKVGKELDAKTYTFDFDYVHELLGRGRAVVFPVLYGSGERSSPTIVTHSPAPDQVDKYGECFIAATKDFLRCVDFVEQFEEATGEMSPFDCNRLGYCGFGWAANLAPIWLVADETLTGRRRFDAIVLCNAGIVQCHQPPEIDQLNYLSELSTPTLMINCHRIVWAPYEKAQKPMYDSLRLKEGREKRFLPFPQYTSRGLTPSDYGLNANRWLDEHLNGR